MKRITQDLAQPLAPYWRRYLKGRGALEPAGPTLRLLIQDATAHQYSDAQLDDYQGLPRRRFPWRPPLTLTVRARFSHPADELKGTAGFGFWNDPFMMTGRRWPTLPRALWFFYASPPSNIKLDLQTPGHGWKAATIDALRWPFFALLPTAPLAIPLMNLRPLYRRLWPLAQQAINVSEAQVTAPMTAWHTYVIRWERRRTRFMVDGEPVLDCGTLPRGPLGFVLWMDNQYAVVTPWGRFRFGLLDIPGRQWLQISRIEIAPDT